MFPGIYEFTWDAGHIIFLGAFYSVLTIVVSTLVIATIRAISDARHHHVDHIRWHAEFDDLPASARACRHELIGQVAVRKCGNGFDCRSCTEHPKFGPVPAPSRDEFVAGFEVPADRLYHRGHTWVMKEEDGTVTVGLDSLAARLLGTPDTVELPEVGAHVTTNGTAWRATKNGADVRVLAPIDGEVISVGGPSEAWYLKIRPTWLDTRHLLTPVEARAWMLREVERLEIALAPASVGPVLADGGAPLDDFSKVIPREQYDAVCGAMMLES